MRRLISSSVSAWMACENSPCSERTAERAALAVAASIRSATASAWARSSLPLRKARRLNSPGSASRAPRSRQRASSICMTTGPPWPCSSSTSSPVKECGPGKNSNIPLSTAAPSAALKSASVAWRGLGVLPVSAKAKGSKLLPEMRITPTPPRPGAVAMAAMVSALFTPPTRQALASLAALLPPSIIRVICHCWAIESTLLTTQ